MAISIDEELKKLEKYRRLFKLIINQPDQTLEYSTDELKHYYCYIEGIEETKKKNFKPFIIYSDPNPIDSCKNINFETYKQYKAGISAEPCIVKLLPNGQPDLSGLIDIDQGIVRLDEYGNPIIKINTTNKETN